MTGPTPVLDVDARLSSVAGDLELLDELAVTFAEEVPGWLAALRSALASGDPVSIHRSAHRVNGAVACFRAPRVQRWAEELETMGREGRLEGAPRVLEQLETDRLEVVRLLGTAPWSG